MEETAAEPRQEEVMSKTTKVTLTGDLEAEMKKLPPDVLAALLRATPAELDAIVKQAVASVLAARSAKQQAETAGDKAAREVLESFHKTAAAARAIPRKGSAQDGVRRLPSKEEVEALNRAARAGKRGAK
jgi:hypothetical protein